MKKLSRFALSVLFLLAACADDKYPMPLQFVQSDSIAITALGMPPREGGARFKQEITEIEHRQAALTPSEKADIAAEDHIRPGMLVQPVLGMGYDEAHYPKLYALLKRAASDAWRIADAHQDYWHSPRPWYADKQHIALLVSPITRPGYPSGHTTTNSVWAYILSDLFPAKRRALFARAYAIGYHRVDAGAHFPHDVEAGKRLAGMLYGVMRKNPDYQAAFKEVKAEVAAP